LFWYGILNILALFCLFTSGPVSLSHDDEYPPFLGEVIIGE
jgi:hypothetical protein